ncbi:three prime repair exonuclease 2 [Microcaecilia unicolor]|uniref:exodeoxyribonuclease III n=1 Tax=Microcaecilia unicolor TaxID=1415580 RepID=A0A6P7XCE7_9AMPH|nr:three prime repair exonuclease 2 [Microcaecilia unicolor]
MSVYKYTPEAETSDTAASSSPSVLVSAPSAIKMAQAFQTYVFLDLEATGLRYDRPRIAEICLIAVNLHSLENPERDEAGDLLPPRILDKICLCVDPLIPLTPKATQITGLSNKNLSNNQKQSFSSSLVGLLQGFLERQVQPVCLVAHNGFNYDFPLLKTELQRVQRDLGGSLACLDSYQALRGMDKAVSSKGYYTLSEVYQRCFGRYPQQSHYAEGDVLTLLMIFLHKAPDFLHWACDHCKSWEDIEPMYNPQTPEKGEDLPANIVTTSAN